MDQLEQRKTIPEAEGPLSRKNGQELQKIRTGKARWELELTALLKILQLLRGHVKKITFVGQDLMNNNWWSGVGARTLAKCFTQLTEDISLLRGRHSAKRRTLVRQVTLLTELTSDGSASSRELMHSEEVILGITREINVTSVKGGIKTRVVGVKNLKGIFKDLTYSLWSLEEVARLETRSSLGASRSSSRASWSRGSAGNG